MTPSTPPSTDDETQIPVASFSDPQIQPYAEHPGRAEAAAGIFLILGLIGFAGFGAAYWQNMSTQWLGLSLGVGLFCFGFGMSAWGKYLLPQGPFEEERHPMRSEEVEREAMAAAVVERGKVLVKRRRFLVGLMGAGGAVMGVVMAFPLLRSLGPLPKLSLATTNWKRGSRLVDFDGKPVLANVLEDGGLLTVFPEGYVDTTANAIDQTVLIRQGYSDVVTAPGRETWAPQGLLAFSKVCTHAGCPVGLYEHLAKQLLCPCHQSLFDVGPGHAANPVFGPAPRPLPQLPLYIDAEGYLRAQRGYDEPVGPGYWERNTTTQSTSTKSV